MKQFALLFRMDITSPAAMPDAEQMKAYMELWSAWIGEIERQGRLAPGGNHFEREGRVVLRDSVEAGPYVADGLSVAGYILVLAADMEEAVTIARECPVLGGEGNSVEVRQAGVPGS